MDNSKACLMQAEICLRRAAGEQLPEVRRKFLASAACWINLGRRAFAREQKRTLNERSEPSPNGPETVTIA